jgi:hypothetical protein
MAHLRKMMLEELERRNYAQATIDCYIQTIEDFALYFRRPPDQLTPEHVREFRSPNPCGVNGLSACAELLHFPIRLFGLNLDFRVDKLLLL